MMYRFGYNTMGGSWVWDLAMLFLGLLVIAGIALLVIWAVRSLSGGHAPMTGQQPGATMPPGTAPRADGHHEAIAIAKRRLASGEITKEQYDEIIKTLGE
jgi:putative membrane protein